MNPEMISLLVFLSYNSAFLDAKIIGNDKTRPDERQGICKLAALSQLF